MFLLLFVNFDMVFCKDIPTFYDKIKCKADNRFYPPTKNNKPWTLFKPNKLKGLLSFWFLGGLHTLVIRERSPGSVVSDMTLYYAQYRHTEDMQRTSVIKNI